MNLNCVNSLVLAYIGDSVYEIYIREFLVKKGINKVNILQKEAIKYVSAKSQFFYLMEMFDCNFLSDFEKDIVKRGRNCKVKSSPKNTDISVYKYSTGFEALIGYLYLNNDKERINEIINFIIKG